MITKTKRYSWAAGMSGLLIVLIATIWWQPAPLPPKKQELPLNDTFTFPFLGEVRVHSKQETVTYKDDDGRILPFNLKVSYAADGKFVRAEYHKPGAKDWELPWQEAEKNYRPGGEAILGIPDHPAPVSLQRVLDALHGSMDGGYEKATKFNITYVIRQEFGKAAPAFIVNMYGTGIISDKISNNEWNKRLRFVFDEKGQLLFIDNTL